MRPSSVALILFITACAGGGVASECPIECYCDTISVATTCDGGDGGLAIPLAFPSETSSRISLHSYKSPRPSDIQRLLLIPINELSLTRNDLTNFPQVNSSSLTLLDLSYNLLSSFSLHPGSLPFLRLLDLSHNQLSGIDPFELPLLETINLSHNRLATLHPSLFKGMKFLQYVNLDSNILNAVPSDTFSVILLPSLAHLILSNNSEILQTTFAFTSPVQFLDLSHSGFTDIPHSASRSVRDLRVTNNALTTISKNTFESYPSLALLVLDDNPIDWVENGTFSSLTSLTRLWMNNNRLQVLPFPLPPALESLHLEDNLLTTLSPSNFDNLTSLSEINLHGNRLSTLPPYVFAGVGGSLISLDLRNNQLTALLQDSFANLHVLTTLDLSLNPIKVFHTGTFAPMGSSLTLLRLSRLQETSLTLDPTALLSPLNSLEMLELNGSPALAVSLLRDHGLAHSPSLRELNLERCKLDDLLITAAALVDHLPRLERVRLEGNDWDCSDFLTTSETQETHEELLFLLKRPGVLADTPTCASPPSLKGLTFPDANDFSKIRSISHAKGRVGLANEPSLKITGLESSTSSIRGVWQNSLVLTTIKATSIPVQDSTTTLNLEDITTTQIVVGKDSKNDESSVISSRKTEALKQPLVEFKESPKTEENVILRTLLIAGVTAILVTLFLLAIGGAILYYRKRNDRSNTIIRSCQRKTSEPLSNGSSYSRFSSDDHVELSGISNRLYTEAQQIS